MEPFPGSVQARFLLFQVKVAQSKTHVEVTLEGTIRTDEMQQFVEQSVQAVKSLAAQGRGVKVLADLRQLRTTSPEAAELLRQGQAAAIQAGMRRIAELVGSELTALQLNRIARGSGMDRILRRFNTEEEARAWLFEADDTLDAA
ncbi:STAS/SEC14 domain-containing protein [Archangium lansingense]|uniref:STAS/SEC14 domain-containing protein n=1 Tax=Archangium lansingense TaxID=2995310 RepID=A0ABT4AAL6_9BACT|nr:STAS/SEC14 domain-containing protein [Archangium lansinium]MCY1078611.1 STAS/SEC14 domain-containing protein [Archangium lansinium]